MSVAGAFKSIKCRNPPRSNSYRRFRGALRLHLSFQQSFSFFVTISGNYPLRSVELARTKGINIPVFSTITQKAAVSNPEINHFVTTPISFATGIILAILIFPTSIAYSSIAVLTLGGGFATIFGKILGKTPLFFNRKKRLEGSFFAFIFAFLGATLFVDPTKALLAATVGILAECLPSPIDDNLMTH